MYICEFMCIYVYIHIHSTYYILHIILLHTYMYTVYTVFVHSFTSSNALHEERGGLGDAHGLHPWTAEGDNFREANAVV